MTSEKHILAEVLIDVTARSDAVAWRHNSGQAWQGNRVEGKPGTLVRLEHGMVILRNARPVKFGLEGSGDIIGAIASRPLAVETKTATGRQRESQIYFQQAWERVGGIYLLARSVEEYRSKLAGALLIG
jgi:hypothetical protein